MNLARLRRPGFLALAAVLVGWLVCFAGMPLKGGDAHPGDGSYAPLRARGDGHYYYLYTLSLGLDFDLDIVDELQTFGDPFRTLDMRGGPNQLPHIRPVGSSLLQLPAFWLAHGAAWVLNHLGAGIPMHGYTAFHQNVVFLGNLLAAFLALVFAWRLARRYASEMASAYAVLFTGLGTGIHFYAAYWSSYNHAFSILFCAWMLEYWDATRGRWDLRRYLALGALLGLLVLVRQQDVLIAAIPAIEGTVELVRRLRARRFRDAAVLAGCGLGAALVASAIVFPQLRIYARHFGGYFSLAEGEQRLRLSSPFWMESLFSSRAGLFVWAPLAWFGVLGLCLRRNLIALAGLGVVIAEAYANGATWAWDGGWSFGARRMLAVTPAIALGLAFFVDQLRALHARFPRLAPHAAFLLLLTPLVAMNLEMATQVSLVSRSLVTYGVPQPVAALYGGSLKRAAQGVSQVVGNPFTWPASLLWAAKHRVGLWSYDWLVGGDRLQIPPGDYRVPGKVHEYTLSFGSGLSVYDGGGWGSIEDFGGRKIRWADDVARIFLPLFVDKDVHLHVTLAPREPGTIEVDVNGRRFPALLRAGFWVAHIAVPDGVLHTGTNEIAIRCGGLRCVAVEELVTRLAPPEKQIAPL